MPMQDLQDLAMERALLHLARFGSFNVFAKIAVVLAAGLPFVVFFGTIYHHLTNTPYHVRDD